MPPTALVLLCLCSVQVGAGMAKQLFGGVGPLDVVSHRQRVSMGALVLVLVSRSCRRGHTRAGYYALSASA